MQEPGARAELSSPTAGRAAPRWLSTRRSVERAASAGIWPSSTQRGGCAPVQRQQQHLHKQQQRCCGEEPLVTGPGQTAEHHDVVHARAQQHEQDADADRLVGGQECEHRGDYQRHDDEVDGQGGGEESPVA